MGPLYYVSARSEVKRALLTYNAAMPRAGVFDVSFLVLSSLAVLFAVVAYLKDPSLPYVGARNGFSLLWFILPRLVPALLLAGMLQVVIPQESVARYFGQRSGMGAIVMASAAGVITPGGPMVSVPLLVVLANSGMALGPLVAYMTAWSLFGMQRIIAWEAPLMGWHFVAVRTVSSLAFPILAGWLVKLYFHE
jgi:uncharacterized membrane protein YraQ (UPF0718 family)